MNNMKLRLIVMNFLEFAVWGAYLTSMGGYLAANGHADNIGMFYAMQGIVSIFMPAIMGIIADRWIPAQKLLGICHLLCAIFIISAGLFDALVPGAPDNYDMHFGIFSLYSIAVAFYMPTLALSNSVAYTSLDKAKLDTVTNFPPIRIFGTIGFICSMLFVDFIGIKSMYEQFYVSGVIGLLLGIYSFTLPACPTSKKAEKKSVIDAFGLKAFLLFKNKKMAIFFIFSMLLGVSLQITNGFASPFINSFAEIKEYADTFGAQHSVALISLSQMSETLCILLIPFALRHFGIKRVMLIAMFAWVLRFGLFGLGNPGAGVWMFILSMIVYGVAFDFFNISGSLFVDSEIEDKDIRSSAQGLFMLMTNGIGATIGTLGAQAVVNKYVYSQTEVASQMSGWTISWLIFAGYALVVGVLFAIIFRYKKTPAGVQK